MIKLSTRKDAEKLVGKIVKVINPYSASGYTFTNDEKLKVEGISSFNNNTKKAGLRVRNNYIIYSNDVELSPQTKKELLKDIENLEDEICAIEGKIETNKMRIAFLEETDAKEFDETTFKSYGILKALEEKGLTDIDKAKLIASIVNG